jgi:hypothetical protein
VAGGWGRLHNEELHNLYTTPNNIRMIKSSGMRWVGHVAWVREMRNACNILVGVSKRNSPLARPKRRWEDNIRIDFREVWWKCVVWIHLAKDRDQWRALMNMVMNLRVIS